MGNFTINKTNTDTGEVTGVVNCEVRAHPIAEPKGRTKGFASITIEGVFGVHGISIVEGKNGLFVSMPQTRDAKGEYKDLVHPIVKGGREVIKDAVLADYAVALDAMASQRESTVQKLRDAASAAKGQAVPEAGKPPKNKNKSDPEH